MSDDKRTQLPMVVAGKAELSLEERLAVAEQREEAVRVVLRALTNSLRPFGFNRQRFIRCVREEGEETPAEGPKAERHKVLYAESRRVLREAR